MNLGPKLILLFISVSIVSSFSVGFFAYRSSRHTIEEMAFDHLMSTTVQKEAEFRRWIAQNKALLEALARRPLVRKYAAELESNRRASPAFLNAHRDLLTDHLIPALKEKGGFLDLSILRKKDGLILISTEASLEEKYREIAPFFLEGKKRTFVGNVIYSLSLESPVMHISTPIRDGQKRLLAVLAGHLDWHEMSDIMRQGSQMTESEETYLVNQFNFFVTESRFSPGYSMKKALHTEGVRACLSKRNGIGMYDDYRQIPVIGAYRWIDDHQLCILTEIDQAEAFAPAVALRNKTYGISAGAALAVILLGVSFSRTVAVRLNELVEGARAFGKGNLGYRLTSKNSDEIGRLSRAFNQMAADLQQITVSHTELQTEVRQRERAEAALREERDRAQKYLNIAGVIILAIDAREQVFLVNQRGCEILGYGQDEIIGKNWFDHFLPRKKREEIRHIFRGLIEGAIGATDYNENTIVAADGRERLIAWHNTVLEDAGGRIVGTLSSGEDITDRRAAEDALQKSEKQLRQVLTNMPVMLDAFDENMNICLWNRHCELVTGYRADEIIDNPRAMNLLYPDEDYRRRMMAEWAARPDDYINWEWDLSCKNGDKRTIAWSSISARVPIAGWKSWGIGVDVTERNRAQRAVEHSLKEKEVLLQEIHHRVKNNMQIIISLLKLQAADMKNEPYYETITESQNRIKSMALLHEKLYRSKNLARISFRSYVEDLAAGLSRSYGIRPDKIGFEIEIGDTWLEMDAAITCGLIINELVSNSLKHAFPEKNTGLISISLDRKADDTLELRVADNGTGWPPGFDIASAGSLGLRLIVMLAEDQLQGTVRFKDDHGAHCIIRFRSEEGKG